jgi:hypothetical protein
MGATRFNPSYRVERRLILPVSHTLLLTDSAQLNQFLDSTINARTVAAHPLRQSPTTGIRGQVIVVCVPRQHDIKTQGFVCASRVNQPFRNDAELDICGDVIV